MQGADIIVAIVGGFFALFALAAWSGLLFIGLSGLIVYEQFFTNDKPSFGRKLAATGMLAVGMVMLVANGPGALHNLPKF